MRTLQQSIPLRRRQIPGNPGLLELIQAKREWCWKPSPAELRKGFRGWHQRGYLPHFDAPQVTQFVTFQLADAFPVTRRAEWQAILLEADESVKRRKLEAWLDRGHGRCWLRRPDVAEVVQGVLLDGDGQEFRMRAWVIMPNHVHLVVDVWDVPLAKLIGRWKGRSSRLANLRLARADAAFWHHDYFDTLIRNAEHLARARRYTERNPLRAYLVKDPRQWPWSSARHRDDYGLLRGERGGDGGEEV